MSTRMFIGAAVLFVAAAQPCKAAAPLTANHCWNANHDSRIIAAGLGHNSFDPNYRSPFGAVKTDQGSIQLRFRTCQYDVEQVRVRVWNTVAQKESWHSMQWELNHQDRKLGPTDYWKVTIPVPTQPTLLFYFFEIKDGNTTHYYVDDNLLLSAGGWGRATESWDAYNTYQITVYDKDFRVPDWIKGAIVYQILPDRFRNGDKSNDQIDATGFVFRKTIRKRAWNQKICDPRGNECRNESDNQFYGGDLQGVIDKLDELKDFGIEAIYFNPVFQAATNHRYDTQDYYNIDRNLGNNELFRKLTEEAKKRGIRIIVDGVFNHGSSDSPYFDVYRRFNAGGACLSTNSSYRDWFIFPHINNKPEDHNHPGTYYYCVGENGSSTTYEAWSRYFEHPVYNKESPVVRNYFFAGPNAVAPFWLNQGASGWRLDVASDVAPGEGVAPNNTYWKGFRQAVKATDPEAVIIAEEWGNASPLLLGREMDTAMNYRFRSALLSWLSDGCSGNGCYNNIFEDEDNNAFSTGGPIAPASERQLDNRLKSIQENYPPETWQAALNYIGSHDTQRVLFVLKKISYDNADVAKQKLAFLSLFQLTYPGAPAIYYGDEVGMDDEGVWYDGRWRDDPYSRAPYRWADEGLNPDLRLRDHYRKLNWLRRTHASLKRGNYETVLTDDARRIFAFSRATSNEQTYVVLNRNTGVSQTVSIPVSNEIPEGAQFEDVLSGGIFYVEGSLLNMGEIPSLWGRILVRRK